MIDPKAFSKVPRRRRTRFEEGDVEGVEIERFREGRRVLYVWQRGDHGGPLIAARLSKRECAGLIRLLGGRP